MSPQDQIEYLILQVMVDDTPLEYRYEYFFPFSCFTRRLTLDREQVRGHLRSMRNRGLTEYGRGFTEDGEVAGAGYTMTVKGFKHWHALKSNLERVR